MADLQTPAAPTTTPAQEPVERTIPKFSDVASESRDARSAELAELAGVQSGDQKQGSTEATPPADTFDFDAEWSKVPERLRTAAAQRLYDGYNAELTREYGDVLPLIVEARQNPELRAALAEMATKDELRQMIADPEVRKQAGNLTKKELREFLFGDALTTYQKYTVADGARPPEKDPRDARLEALETRYQHDADERETGSYIGGRRNEVAALTNSYPALAQDQKFLAHVVEIAESRFEAAALRAGVKTTDNPGWPAQAIRAGVKPPSYLEAYQYQAEVSGRSAPPAAPATSPATAPVRPQAPRTVAEGKAAGVALVKKAGGFNSLAAAASRRGR